MHELLQPVAVVRVVAALALAVLGTAGCGASANAGARRSASVLVGGRRPCGTATRPPARYDHVVWIVMENKGYSDVIGAGDAPYENSLARACGVAASFFAETHPSAPNYVAMTSGGTQGVTGDPDPVGVPLRVPSIFSQLGAGGWRALAESMPGRCRRRFALPEYYARHNAPAYYVNLGAQCARYDVPLGRTPDLSARFTFVAPNSCHSMHTCDVAAGDAWLARFVPEVLRSPQYRRGRTALFVTWDESEGGGANHIPTLVVAPSVRHGTIVRARFDHYSLLRTTEEMLGLPRLLGRARTARSMRAAFGI